MSISLSENKKERIDEINRFVEMKAIERSNADLLIKLINNAETIDEVISIFQLCTAYRNTGFYYDIRLEPKNDNTIKYFKKNSQLSFVDKKNPNANTHKLIIGDNYEALLNLLIEYKGKIDVIYIDPPYGKDSMGQFAQTNYNNSITRDNLLSELHSRLLLAKQLLSKNGVLFCSCDDKNQAYFKCLFDEIFGENNFIGNIIWQSATDNNPSQISTEHEYILCFANNKSLQGKWLYKSKKAELIINKYNELKNKYADINIIQKELRAWINKNKVEFKGIAHYNNVDDKGVYSNSTNSSDTKPGNYTYDIIHPISHKPCSKPANGWRWPEETFWEYARNDEIDWGEDETTQPHVKKRIETIEEQLKSVYYEDSRGTTKMLSNIMESKVFDNPKPIDLIKTLLKFTSNTESVVLDFYAGSGTTGQAVLEMNQEDDGNRKFILVQYPEDLDKNSKSDVIQNGIKLLSKLNLPLKISSITNERLRRVMTGHAFDGTSILNYANEPLGGSLEVYDICYVSNREVKKGLSAFDVIDETLYGQIKFETLKEKITWVCNNFDKTQESLTIIGGQDAPRS